MAGPISISKTLSIRDCGLDEYWLQDQIATNPGILGLGELELVRREKQQSSGGRLDLLLKDPEDDTMYEVEVMLGATDESHIIRTIEYWDLEKRRWPQRQHYAVLVAESVTRRFFNVIQLLSLSILVIAIQANIIEADGKRILHFAKVLDAYEEPEEETTSSSEAYDEAWWKTRSLSNLETAKALIKVVTPVYGKLELGYAKSYIAVKVANSFFNQFRLKPLNSNKSRLLFWMNSTDAGEISATLDQIEVPVTSNKTWKDQKQYVVLVDQKLIESNTEQFQKIAEIVKKCGQI